MVQEPGRGHLAMSGPGTAGVTCSGVGSTFKDRPGAGQQQQQPLLSLLEL